MMGEDIFINAIRNRRKLIYELLEKYPVLRDDDARLILNVWVHEFPVLKTSSFITFSEIFKSGQMSHPETIRRTRQKLQEENAELRGRSYKNRHKISSFTRQNIRDL